MTLCIVVKSPSGLVVAADSRVTLTATQNNQTFPIHFDNATKLLRFGEEHNYVAAVTYGQAVMPGSRRTAESYVPEFIASLPSQERLPIAEFAEKLSKFYTEQFRAFVTNYQGSGMGFLVAGFDKEDHYGRVFSMSLPNAPEPREQIVDGFAALWDGDYDFVTRIWLGHALGLPERIAAAFSLDEEQQQVLHSVLREHQAQIPVDVMALQDSVDLAITLIRVTILMQQLAATRRTVGGPIDVVTITRTAGVRVVQFKEVTGHGT